MTSPQIFPKIHDLFHILFRNFKKFHLTQTYLFIWNTLYRYIVAVLILKRRKFVANLFCIRFCWWRRSESFYDSFLSYFLKESHFWSFLTRGELKNYVSYNKGAQPYAHNVARAGVWSGPPSRRQLKILIENSFLEVRDNEINNFFPHSKYLPTGGFFSFCTWL